MKHKWNVPVLGEIFPGMKGKTWICKVCGCKKILGNYKFAEPTYERSSQIYDHYVECFDMELENEKTID